MSEKLRVLLDCRMATWTGVGRYTVGLTRALARREDLEIVQLVATGNEPPVPAGERVDFVVAHAPAFSFGGMREFSRVAFACGCDVHHAMHFPTPFPARHPLVVTLHDLSPLVVEGLMPSAAKRAVYRYLNARASQVADRIIVPSSHTGGDVARHYAHAAERIRVVPEAADDFTAGTREELTGPLADLAARPYILSMGSTRPHKDLPTLFSAFATVARKHEWLRLVLVGAEDPAYLEQHLAGMPQVVRDSVVFTGRVSDGELRTLYAGAELFAFPSTYEGFGLPPLEAMGLGTPVVCSDSTSLPEVVGEAAVIFPAGDAGALATALDHVLTDRETREQLREAGLSRASRLTWDEAARKTVDVYREAVAR